MKVSRVHGLPGLGELQQFVAVAKAQSFSGAGRELNQTTATVSAGVKRLESTLGVRLFERSTRLVRLTEAGRTYLSSAQDALNALALGTEAIQQSGAELAGKIVLSAPTDLTRTLLSCWLQEFMQANPRVELEVRVTDALSNFYEDPIDLAIRYGAPPDSNVIARPFFAAKRILCASKDYLHRHSIPKTPSDLPRHQCICYKLNSRVDTKWHFIREGIDTAVNVKPYLITDDSGLAREWAIAGQGFVYKSELDLVQDITDGRLVQCLEDYQGSDSPLFLVYPSVKNQTNRVRCLIEFLLHKVLHY